MSKLDRVANFIQVVESNSFTKAAQKLRVSTAAISKQITKLEEEIGIQLVYRTTRRLELTEPGRLYYQRCKSLLDQVEEIEKFALSLNQEPTGDLRVVSARYFGEKYITPYLKEFMGLYPKLKLDLEFAERIPDLFKENVDILYGVSMPGSENWVQKVISRTRYSFCASPEYLKRNGIPKQPSDLIHHAYITHKMRKPDDVVEFKNGAKIFTQPILRLNDTGAMLSCALDGIGIVMLHHYVVADAIKKKQLVEVLKDFVNPELPVYLYYQPSQYVQPKIRKFIEFFSEKMRK